MGHGGAKILGMLCCVTVAIALVHLAVRGDLGIKVLGREVLQAGVLERERRGAEVDVRNTRLVCLSPCLSNPMPSSAAGL